MFVGGNPEKGQNGLNPYLSSKKGQTPVLLLAVKHNTMRYYVVNTCPNFEGAENAHWAMDMIARCETAEEAWLLCHKLADELVEQDPCWLHKEVMGDNTPDTRIDVLSYGDCTVEASYTVFELDCMFGSGRFINPKTY